MQINIYCIESFLIIHTSDQLDFEFQNFEPSQSYAQSYAPDHTSTTF